MPDDQGNQPQNPNQSSYPEPQPTQYLTDEVPPDISAQVAAPVEPVPAAPQTPPPSPAPSFPIPEQTTPTPPPMPQTPPLAPAAPLMPQPASPAAYAPKRNFPLVTLLLMLIAIGAIAATYFFYLQTQSLNTQLNQLNKTLQNQQTLSPTPTESVTPEASISATPTATVSGILTPTLTIAPTTISSLSPLKAFDQMTLILGTAQAKYSDAQLILIQVYHGESADQTQTKYWFRQSPTVKKYLYVMKESGKNLVLLDDPGLKVSPDSDIPSLNQMALNNQLGIDLPEAITIALANCPSSYDCANSSVTAQFIKANTTLWELTLTAPNSNSPFVIQIDSITKKILFKSA